MSRRKQVIRDFDFEFDAVGYPLMDELERFISYHNLKSSSDYTIRNIASAVTNFYEWLLIYYPMIVNDTSAINADVIKDYIMYLKSKNLKPKTINNYIKMIRMLFNYLVKIKHLKKSPFTGSDIVPLKENKDILHIVTKQEFEEMLAQLNLHRMADVTTYTLMYLLYYTGCRIGEAQKLNVSDIDFSKKEIIIRESKNGSDRIIPLHKKLEKVLLSYLRIRGDIEETALFINYNDERITPNTLSRKIKEVAKKCGFEKLSSHAFRRSLATRLLESGADLLTIKEILGHSDLKMLLRYVKISNEKMHKEINKL